MVVSTNQPKGKMVKVLFEPNSKLSDSITYDITAWSLPYAYGLEAIASKTLIPFKHVKPSKVSSLPNKQAIAYVMKWNHIKDAELLSELLKKNIKVRFSEKPFTSENPETVKINNKTLPLEGYLKSLKKDKEFFKSKLKK